MKYSLKKLFLTEVAKTVEDLPEDVFVELGPNVMGGSTVYLKTQQGKELGHIGISPAKEGCRGAYIVTDSLAEKGFGPLLYDLALELAGNNGVTPDRDSVSAQASNVWKYYYENRSDVRKEPLDDKEDPQTPPKEDDCSFDASRAGGSISFLGSSDEIQRPWLNYVYYASGRPNLSKLESLGKLKEGIVPQGSADERPLHGAPTYFYQVGRSLPKKMQDRGGQSSARKWNKDGGLLDVEDLEKKEEKKKRWYQKESVRKFRRPSNDDLYDAVDHASDYIEQPISLNDFRLVHLGKMSVDELNEFDDLSAWHETIEDEEEFEYFRGKPWAEMAKKWGNNPPPVVVVTGKNFSVIGDGRGRIAYADWKKIPLDVWALELKEIKNESLELDQKGTRVSLEVFRQDSAWSTQASEKLSREKGKRGTPRKRTERRLKEFNALATAAIEASNIPPDMWERDNAPRVSEKGWEKNEKYVKKLDVTKVDASNGKVVYVDHMDPQFKRQISILEDDEVLPWKEPSFLDGRGEHRIAKLGYAKIADRQDDLKMDVYLSPYDPNWRRSEEMMQQVIKHWISNHGNRERIYPEPDATMMVSIKEAWDDVKDTFKEYYPHDPAINDSGAKPGTVGDFSAMTIVMFHGSDEEYAAGDYIKPEQGLVTMSPSKETIEQENPKYVYDVKPMGPLDWVDKETELLASPLVMVVKKVR